MSHCVKGDAHTFLELLQPVEGETAAVLQKRNHGAGRGIVFSSTSFLGQGGSKHLPAQVAAEFLEFP